MIIQRFLNFYEKPARLLIQIAMWAAIFSLPVTSLPLLSRLMGGSQVAPLAAIFVVVGLVISLPLAFQKGRKWPVETIPLLVFVLVALVSSFLSLVFQPPLYKDIAVQNGVIKGGLTLIIGVSCFIFFATGIQKPEQYRVLFALIDLGGLMIIGWSFLQIYFNHFPGQHYPAWFLSIHHLLSITTPEDYAFLQRVTGFAFEPSWLAHQMNTLYLPFWLGATFTGFSAFRIRIWKISMENLLLVGGIAMIIASLSRIGYISLMLVLAFLFWRGSGVVAASIVEKMDPSSRMALAVTRNRLRVVILAGFVLLGGLGILLLAQFDPRVAAIFVANYRGGDLFSLVNRLSLAERFAYWGLGWNVFTRAPWLGVGLGNVGFYLKQDLPAFGWALSEFQKIYLENAGLANCKNLWLRLLSETGVLGFAVFLSWLSVVFASINTLFRKAEPIFRTMGWMGMLALVALIGEGFSVDSFALPYYWTALGMAVAASFMARHAAETGSSMAG